MKPDNKKLTLAVPAAEDGICTDTAETAEVSNPQTGETNNFDAESENEKTAVFDELIAGKFKKQFAAKVQNIIDRRLKEVKKMKNIQDKNAQIVEILLNRYNITDGDTDKLEKILTDEKYGEEKKKYKQIEEENNYLKRRRMADLLEMKARNRAENWKRQAEETKKAYPEFDFEHELDNEEFRRLLKLGVSVKNAYEVVNIRSILDKNNKDTERTIVNSIRSKGTRPVENGAEPTGGILLSGSVSNLTKKERAELAKRAAKGEQIRL